MLGNTCEILHKFTVSRQGLKSGWAWGLVAGGDTQFLCKCGGRIWSAGGLSDKSGWLCTKPLGQPSAFVA